MEKASEEFFVKLTPEGIATLLKSGKKAFFFEGKWHEWNINRSNGNGNGNGKGGEEKKE
jgi:hypothetical protein